MGTIEPRLAPVQAWQDAHGGFHATEESALRKNNLIVSESRRSFVVTMLQRMGHSTYAQQIVNSLLKDWPSFRDNMEVYYNAYERTRK